MSDPIFGFIIIGVSVLLVWGITRAFSKNKRETLADKIGADAAKVIEAFRKKLNSGAYFTTPGIRGSIEVFTIAGIHYYEITLTYKMPFHETFTISREGSLSRAKKKFGIQDILIGDPYFDEKLFLECSSPVVLPALLNSTIRKDIIMLAGTNIDFSITQGKAHLIRDLSATIRNKSLVMYATSLASIVGDLLRKMDIMDRLIEIILYDPLTDVRIRCIRLLADHYRTENKTRDALRKCLDDEFLDIVFESAQGLGEEGLDHLSTLLVSSKKLKPRDRIRIVRIFSDAGYRKGIPALVHLYSAVPLTEKILILQVMTKLGDESCSDFLLDCLKVRDPDIHPHVLEALELCGNTDSLKRLRIMAASTRGKMIRSSYDDVADRIASRLGKTGSGRLSLEEISPMEGALSRDNTPGEGALSGEREE